MNVSLNEATLLNLLPSFSFRNEKSSYRSLKFEVYDVKINLDKVMSRNSYLPNIMMAFDINDKSKP